MHHNMLRKMRWNLGNARDLMTIQDAKVLETQRISHCFIASLLHWFTDSLIHRFISSLFFSVHWHLSHICFIRSCTSQLKHFIASASQNWFPIGHWFLIVRQIYGFEPSALARQNALPGTESSYLSNTIPENKATKQAGAAMFNISSLKKCKKPRYTCSNDDFKELMRVLDADGSDSITLKDGVDLMAAFFGKIGGRNLGISLVVYGILWWLMGFWNDLNTHTHE